MSRSNPADVRALGSFVRGLHRHAYATLHAQVSQALAAGIDAEEIREEEKQADVTPGATDVAKEAMKQAGGVDAVVNQVSDQLFREGQGTNATVKRLQEASARQARAQARRDAVPAGDFIARQKADEELAAANAAAAAATADVGASQQDARTRATQIADRAREADPAALAELQRRLPGSVFGQATPEAMRAQDAEVQAVEDEGRRRREMRERRNKRAKFIEMADREEATANKQLGDATRDERDRWDAIADPIRRDNFREGLARDQQAAERLMGGGFSADEGAVLSRGNAVAMRGARGGATPAEVARALAEAESAASDIEAGGGMGSDVYSRIIQLGARLSQIQVQMQQQQVRQNQQMGGGPNDQSFTPAYWSGY